MDINYSLDFGFSRMVGFSPLAMREGVPLATLDDVTRAAAVESGVAIIPEQP
jgi:hypothetical protein